MWVALVVLILTIVVLSARREGYAPPRDENTQPPFTEDVGNTVTVSNNLPYVDSTSNVVRVDNQSQIYKDMGGMEYQIQAGNPILNFIQGDPSSNVMYGDFVANESDGGYARMYAYGVESNVSTETSTLPPVPKVSSVMTTVSGVDINGTTFTPDAGQYIPMLTSQTISFLGDQPGISASESQASATSPTTTQ